jgi:hypothetical protein
VSATHGIVLRRLDSAKPINHPRNHRTLPVVHVWPDVDIPEQIIPFSTACVESSDRCVGSGNSQQPEYRGTSTIT